MEYKDYYKTLGVARSASADEIKRAYRKLARRHHPDVSDAPDAAERFREANEAYEALRDPERRAAYDRIDPSRSRGHGFTPPPGWDTQFDFGGGRAGGRSRHTQRGTGAGRRAGQPGADRAGANPGDSAEGDGFGFSAFFDSLFGQNAGGAQAGRGARQSSGPGPSQRGAPGGMPGRDSNARIEIDLEDAFTGGTRLLQINPEPGDGSFEVGPARSVKVGIPKGVRAGQKLRLAGQGHGGFGGPAGDLYLEVAFRPHPYFTVEGRDLTLELPVAPWEAALGATVKTPTPAGAVDLRIPADSNGGRRLRLKGRGLPGTPPGDLYVVLRIHLPTPADMPDPSQARALYERMAAEMAFNPRQRLGV